jgi:methionine-rich copper-binding protein CopC
VNGFRRLLAVLPLVGLALLVGAGPAAAHNVLLGSDPPDGASLAAGPNRVSLRFDLPVRAGFNTLLVVGPDGLAYQRGAPAVSGSTVSTAVGPLGPAGRYEIRYRIVSDDGHPVSGTVAFGLTTAGTGTGAPLEPGTPPAPTPAGGGSNEGSGGMPLWPWLLAAGLLVVGGVLVAVRLGR